MKKLIPYIVSLIIAIQTLTPPLPMAIKVVDSAIGFVWLFLFCGFLSLFFIFTKANVFLKILLPYLFINSFLSHAPYLSMTSFIWTVVCAYFYLLCLEIDDWKPIFKTVSCLLFIEIMLLILKAFHKETLLNFGFTSSTCVGSVGNAMQYKSIILILIAISVQNIKKLKDYLYLIYIVIFFLGVVYWTDHKCWTYFTYARGGVWLESIRLTFSTWNTSLIGYGIGTFKALFPAYGKGRFLLEGIWNTAHNFYIENLFELGVLGFGILIGLTVSLLKKCRGLLLLGAILVGYTLMFQIPDRQCQTVPLLILFVAFIERKIYADSSISTGDSEYSSRTYQAT